MERHFIIGAYFNHHKGTTVSNIGIHLNGVLPTHRELRAYIEKEFPGAENIVVLSVCEVSEEDYKSFYGEK